MHLEWPSFDQAEQYCTHSTQFVSILHKLEISAPNNGGMRDLFIRAQTLKWDITDIIEDEAKLIIYLVYCMHGFAGIRGRGIKNKNK
jgi:hypothetical protein